MLAIPLSFLLLLQVQADRPPLSARIHSLLHTVLFTDDDEQSGMALAEAKAIFVKQGLPAIADVGDAAAYEFVLLTCSGEPVEFQRQVLQRVRERAKRGEIPSDAVSYCAAHVRQESIKARVKKHAPAQPALRNRIQQLFEADQAVRSRKEFDLDKMSKNDLEQAAALEAIFLKHGMPTYRLVGPEAASNFVVLIQHQSPDFRRRALPQLKANVLNGQADPGSYAMMLDRSLSDEGKKQVYGENLTCDRDNPKLHTGPIEDEGGVNRRRGEIGLIRLEIYARLVIERSPNVCPAGSEPAGAPLH